MVSRVDRFGAFLIIFAGRTASAATPPVAKITPGLRQAYSDNSPALFVMLDTDRDGQIDRNEAAFDLALRKRFGQADTDTNAAIDRGEYQDFHEAELQRLQDRARGR